MGKNFRRGKNCPSFLYGVADPHVGGQFAPPLC
jgi:hypothetical protein